MSRPTPKTLDEAIEHFLFFTPSENSLKGISDRCYDILRDFMAQKFNPAYLKARGDELVHLQELFHHLTRRDK